MAGLGYGAACLALDRSDRLEERERPSLVSVSMQYQAALGAQHSSGTV